MHRVVRALLVWVMVIAVPVQGMAAAAMLCCGPSHARMMPGRALDASDMLHSHAGDATHRLAAMGPDGGHHHPAGAAVPIASEPTGGADDDGARGLSPHDGTFSCSACAAGCIALALPARVEPPAVVHTGQALESSPVAPVTSHHPDGLDRPPRAAIA